MFCVLPRKPAPFYFGRAASVGKVRCCVYENESCSSCSSTFWHWNKSAWWSYQHLKFVMDQPPLISSFIHGPVTGGRLKSLLKRNNQRKGEDVQMQITLWVHSDVIRVFSHHLRQCRFGSDMSDESIILDPSDDFWPGAFERIANSDGWNVYQHISFVSTVRIP